MRNAGINSWQGITRSTLAATAALALAHALLPETAQSQQPVGSAVGAAAPTLRLPLRFAYVRLGPGGLMRLSSEEQTIWRAMRTRLGGLSAEPEPLQPYPLIGDQAPEVDGGATAAMAARDMARRAGFDLVLLYAIDDGKRGWVGKRGWLSKIFAAVRTAAEPHAPASAEAYLLDVGGGPPVLSIAVNAAPRAFPNPFDGRPAPDRETLALVANEFERRLREAARPQFTAERSIASGNRR